MISETVLILAIGTVVLARHGHAALSGRRHQHSPEPADDGTGCGSADTKPALFGLDDRFRAYKARVRRWM
jgi:hypothetical protein